MTIDLKMLQRLADPSSAAKAAEAGLPTIDVTKFKDAVAAKVEAKATAMVTNATNMVSGIMDDAHKVIEEAMDTVSNLTKTNPKTSIAKVKELTKKIADLKAAQETAIKTGNFIPLLAASKPEMNLKSLPKSLFNL